jgi:hypothetical protein
MFPYPSEIHEFPLVRRCKEPSCLVTFVHRNQRGGIGGNLCAKLRNLTGCVQ